MSEEGRFDPSEIARNWWKELKGEENGRGRDKAAFAALRRNSGPLELAFVPSFALLRKQLTVGEQEWKLRRAATIAHVLGHVHDDSRIPVAQALGSKPGGDSPVMSTARFRRLLQARDNEDDLARRLVRAVRMLKNTANVADLAQAIWWWNDHTRRDWAFRYLDADPPGHSHDAT